jgi:hypothetical protein
MMQGPELPLLSNWQNFYMIIGTAAATLTGLMFVVTTLIASIDAHLSTLNAAVSAFNTPTVVQFGTVLLLVVAAFVLPKNPAPTLVIVAAAMILLLLVGIRNAWDMVTFLAVERAHSENKSRE